MATAVIDQDEILMECGICFNRYDLEDRKPKFLQCSHTICLPCAKVIFNAGVICCPFCRLKYGIQSADSLPNNNYATQILGLIQRNKQTLTESTAPKTEGSITWCLGCQSAVSSLCTALGHSTINITSETMKNMEQTVQLKNELMKMKDQGINTLAQVIQKREKIREHLSLVRKSIQAAEDELKKLEDDNNLILAKVTSIKEFNKQPSGKTTVVNQEKDGQFTSELKSMIDDFNPEDTMETLKRKMKKTLDTYDGYLIEATSTTSSYGRLENMKMTVVLNNVASILTLDLTKKNRSKHEVMLLSHCILSLLMGNQRVLATLPKSVSPPSSFVLGQSNFILKVYRSGVAVDELWIQPCTTFDNDFIQKLGTLCYKSPKKLGCSIKAVPDVHLTLSCNHAFPNYVRTPVKSSPLVTKALMNNEVGLEVLQVLGKNAGAKTQWKMVFPLKKFNDPKYKMHVKDNKEKLFGKIIKSKPETLITELSNTNNKGRSNITFTLESA